MKEINKIIEVSAACCVQLGTLLIPKLLRISITAARCYKYPLKIKYISSVSNMPSQKRCLAQLTCDKQKIAKQSESDRSSTQIAFGTSSCLFI